VHADALADVTLALAGDLAVSGERTPPDGAGFDVEHIEEDDGVRVAHDCLGNTQRPRGRVGRSLRDRLTRQLLALDGGNVPADLVHDKRLVVDLLHELELHAGVEPLRRVEVAVPDAGRDADWHGPEASEADSQPEEAV
jgi:hypothetical protein